MIIGISGKIGSGKDECGQYLVDNYGFKIIKFATIIKKVAVMMTGESYETQISQEGKQKYLKDWGMTIREFQQLLGTDAVRNGLHNDAWVIATLKDYHPDENWVVTDTRFENEADKVKALGGTLIRVDRPNNPFPQSDHPSETSLDNYMFDHYIANDSTISALHLKTAKIMSHIL
tara:strand:- start:8016 stop:8540 length:525 start_codon:yes stop_codon:yes gene_type:complete